MARKSDSDTETVTSSTVDESTATRRASNPSSRDQDSGHTTSAGDREQDDTGGPKGVLFTAEGADSTHQPRRVTTADDYPDSQQVKDGEWNPSTHGPPPDSRPKRNY